MEPLLFLFDLIPWPRGGDKTASFLGGLLLSVQFLSVISAIFLYYFVGSLAAIIALIPVLALVAGMILFTAIALAAVVLFWVALIFIGLGKLVGLKKSA